jgi:hypothetical protein
MRVVESDKRGLISYLNKNNNTTQQRTYQLRFGVALYSSLQPRVLMKHEVEVDGHEARRGRRPESGEWREEIVK